MSKAKKLPSGRWRCRPCVTVNGEKIVKSFTADSRREAELLASKWQNGLIQKANADITLKEAFNRYIDSKSAVLSPNTIREYKRLADCVLKEIMQINISKLTQEQVQIAINQESQRVSAKTVRNIHGLLSAVLRMFRPTFTLYTALPQREKKELYIPTENEIKTILKYVKGTDMELPIMLAAFGPLRRGEICALKKSDIDGLKVTVNKSMAKTPAGEWVVKPPKTYAGNRVVELPEFMRPLLENVDENVTDLTPGTITNKFHSILKKIGISVFRFHDLRHYCVSFLHSHNVPTKYIMARGGWCSENVVNNIYNHILRDTRDEIEIKINNLLNETFK